MRRNVRRAPSGNAVKRSTSFWAKLGDGDMVSLDAFSAPDMYFFWRVLIEQLNMCIYTHVAQHVIICNKLYYLAVGARITNPKSRMGIITIKNGGLSTSPWE